MQEFIGNFFQNYGPLLLKIGVFLGSAVVLYGLGRFVLEPMVSGWLERAEVDDHARKPLLNVIRILVVIGAIGLAFGISGFGYFLSSIATIIGAGTLAIGFAMQDVIKNFVSGVLIFIERPFRIGDWIEWDDRSGIVRDIQLRSTRVQTFDNEILTVPNSDLTDGVIKNPVAEDKLRIKFVFGIGYEDDIGKARDIILEEAGNIDGILQDPEPSVRLTELADSYVGLQSRFWIENPGRSDFIQTRSEYIKAVKERFDREGINIPFPQRDLSGSVEFTGDSGGGAPAQA